MPTQAMPQPLQTKLGSLSRGMLAAGAPLCCHSGRPAAPQKAGSLAPITRSCRQGLLRAKSGRARERPCRMGAACSGAIKGDKLRSSRGKQKPSRKNDKSDHSAAPGARLLLSKVLARSAVHVRVPSVAGFGVARFCAAAPIQTIPNQSVVLHTQRIWAMKVPLVPFLVGQIRCARSCSMRGCLFREPALCIAIPRASNHDTLGRCAEDIITGLMRASQWLTFVSAASQLCQVGRRVATLAPLASRAADNP